MKFSLFLFGKVVLLAAVLVASNIFAAQLAPPKFRVTDRFGINIPNGQVATSVSTLSIGGSLGLSHSISSYTSNFLSRGGFYTTGLNDRFGGSALFQKLAEPSTYYVKDILGCLSDCNFGFSVMRVHDHEDSVDFKVMQGYYVIGHATSATSGYTYQAMSDLRHRLEIPTNNPGYMVWTKPDGTEVWFHRSTGATTAAATGYIQKIIYPTGFTLTFHRDVGNDTILGVTTNTGFQLKYNYVKDNSPKQGIGADNTNVSIPAENTYNWSLNNPKSVVGINSAIEYCDNNRDKICTGSQNACPTLIQGQVCTALSKSWPTAKFNWPLGMPRAFFFGEKYFSVIDSSNRTTQFRVKAHDTAIDENGNTPTSVPANYNFLPRIVGVKPANASAETITYSYKNYFTNAGTEVSDSFYVVPGETGYISRASGIVGVAGYNRGMQGWSPGSNPYTWQTSGADAIVVQRNDLLGAYYKITDLDGDTYFEQDYRNFPIQRINKNGPTEDYEYGGRGNLLKIVYNKGTATQTSVEAEFPGSCTNPKTCNQANWISDAKGNKTYYTYHPDSGQVATITYPANKNGITAQTRFTYAQKYANYFNSSGVKTQSATPVWLKTEERSCINSNPSGNGCAGGDEVVTRFEYLHDNLLLTGMTVTDPQGASLRTCYQYDIYGNRIGETQPKANLASCN